MKLEDQVCTLEQAKRLKALGISQNSYLSWCGDETSRLKDNGNSAEIGPWVFVSTTIPFNNMEADYRADVPSAKPFASAFTVAEMGAMILPESNTCYTILSKIIRNGGRYGECGVLISLVERETRHTVFKETTEAAARAAMLIHLLENNIVNIDEINSRLNK